ncbi:MAG: DNA translocase FtsK [Tissierellia bacterium]|nr:DNA translocase FtsK [Tissierellia bacterium]
MVFIAFLLFYDTLQVDMGGFKDHYELSLDSARGYEGSGVVGMFLSHPLRKFLGDIGSYIVVSMILIYATFLLFNVEKKDIIIGTQKCVDHIEDKLVHGYKAMKNRSVVRNPDKALELDTSDELKVSAVEESAFEFNNYNEPVKTTDDIETFIEVPLDSKRAPKEKTEKGETTLHQIGISGVANELKTDAKKPPVSGKKYIYPPIDLLNPIPAKSTINKKDLAEKAKTIESTLRSFGIEATVESINRGPTITCYELKPARGVRVSKITNLHDDLSMALQTKDIRIVAPIPGKSRVGIEAPNATKDLLFLREIIDSKEFKQSKNNLPMALGKDITGKIMVSSISDMPHLLIAGATGSGKSVCINSLILSLLYKSSPEDVKLILIDPKVVELSVYNGIPHLLIPVVTDPKKAGMALEWAVTEMDRRYGLFAINNARDFASYNEKVASNPEEEKLKKIVVIIDELADLMLVSGQEVEDSIARLAQMARAAGIYLIVATQRPSVDVITGTIKANIPSRISFAVSSQIDSRTILDMAGAEKLLGKGDMLFLPSSQNSPTRIQGAFVTDKEVESVVQFLKSQYNEASYDTEVIEQVETKLSITKAEDQDELLKDAIVLVVKDNQGSISYLQRRLKVGYSRAARMIDQMEEMGVVGPNEGSKPRKVLINLDEIDDVVKKLTNE